LAVTLPTAGALEAPPAGSGASRTPHAANRRRGDGFLACVIVRSVTAARRRRQDMFLTISAVAELVPSVER
jgi:hypothetical protein